MISNMALPKKMAGYRPLVHAGEQYRWRFCHFIQGWIRGDANAVTTVTAIHEQYPASPLLIQLPEYRDPWLLTDAKQLLSMPAITPAFVAQAIAFAQAQGWKPAQQRKAFKLTWQAAKFRTLSPQFTSR